MLKIRNRAESTAVPKLPLTWSASTSMPRSDSDDTATQAPTLTPRSIPEPNANALTPQASFRQSAPTVSDANHDRAATPPPHAADVAMAQAVGHAATATDSAQPPTGSQLVTAKKQHDMADETDFTAAGNGTAGCASPAEPTSSCTSTGDKLTPSDDASASHMSSTASARATDSPPTNAAMPATAPRLATAATAVMSSPPVVLPTSSSRDNTAPDDAPGAQSAETAAITPDAIPRARPAANASTPQAQPIANLAAAASPDLPAPTAPPSQRQRPPAPPQPTHPQSASTAPTKGKIPAKPTPPSEVSVYTITGDSDTVGMQLLQHRANAHVTVEEIARRTRVSRDFIVNLEEGNYAKLPADQFCLWEIERLCFEYDIDPEPIKELFEQESRAAGRETGSLLATPASRADSAAGRNVLAPMGLATEEDSAHSLYSLPGLLIGILVVAILVLVASAFFYQQSQRNKPTTTHTQPQMDVAQHIKPRRPPLDLLQIPTN